jgi:demethylmenaquinone methyltransferase/2-methoxy-6-polyprenyl-1,4-benzoquinol methylase
LVLAVGKKSPKRVLDLATGSGDVAFALAVSLPKGTEITGMDFCQPMLDEASAKKSRAEQGSYANVDFKLGDGLSLPLPDGCFDAVTISFGLRNMADRHRSLCEMRRVLKPGGSVVILEFSQPQTWFKPFYYFYLRRILPLIAGAVTGDRAAYVYLNETIGEFPDRSALSEEIRDAGFSAIKAKGLTLGIVALHEAQA